MASSSFNPSQLSWEEYMITSGYTYGSMRENPFKLNRDVNSRIVLTMGSSIAAMQVDCLVYPYQHLHQVFQQDMKNYGGDRFLKHIGYVTPRNHKNVTILSGQQVASARDVMYIFPSEDRRSLAMSQLYDAVFDSAVEQGYKSMVMPNLTYSESEDDIWRTSHRCLWACRERLESSSTINRIIMALSDDRQLKVYETNMMTYFPGGMLNSGRMGNFK